MAARRRPSDIPIGPKPPKAPAAPPRNTNPPAPTGGANTGGAATGSAADPYKSYLAQQRKEERKARRAENRRLLGQAADIGVQISALQGALGRDGSFRQALDAQLENVMTNQIQAGMLQLEKYNKSRGVLEGSASDNEKAADRTGYENVVNRGRERMNAMSESIALGAGESDMLRSQEMALRNWSANETENRRGYYDTLRSIQAADTDLENDTKTAFYENIRDSNAARNQLWQEYYGQRSEALLELGNLEGRRSEIFGAANLQVGSKKTRRRRNRSQTAMGNYYERAVDVQGQAYDDPGVGALTMAWEGAPDFESRLNQGGLDTSTGPGLKKKPEGASLRRWD